jgi:predicted lipid-binding transport protein (Tim44 family)
MKQLKTSILLILSVLSILTMTEADAARMGSGKSFGSKPSYSQPYRAPSSADHPSAAPQQAIPATPAMARNQAARESFGRRGGLMGMLGGLALGGMLGAMLFGGAFEHINFMDIIIFALVAFLLYKFLSARRSSGQAAAASSPGMARQQYEDTSQRSSGFETDVLSTRQRSANAGNVQSNSLPADFDKNAFMSGAKAAYMQLQQAWDSGQLSEMRALTTDQVFAELQDQVRARTGANHTEILQTELKLLGVADVAGDTREASVQFDVLMREDSSADPLWVHEIWHFIRSKHSKQPTWYLDGIQQIEG